jgi:hypothetical protein
MYSVVARDGSSWSGQKSALESPQTAPSIASPALPVYLSGSSSSPSGSPSPSVSAENGSESCSWPSATPSPSLSALRGSVPSSASSKSESPSPSESVERDGPRAVTQPLVRAGGAWWLSP